MANHLDAQPRTWPPVLFAFGLTAVLSCCAWLAIVREGSFGQPLTWDSANYYGNAIIIKRAIADRWLFGLADAWVNTSGTHTPLVPTLTAILMLIFGESRAVALATLPIFTWILLYSTVLVVRRLYPREDGLRGLAPYLTAILVATFPVALTQSRNYLFEYPVAAMTAATCYSILTADNFSRLRPSILLGVLVGLTSVTRTGAPTLLIGPCVVAGIVVLRNGLSLRQCRNIGIAVAVALVIGASWYVPNWTHLSTYIFDVTYGDRAEVYTGASSAISRRNLVYMLEWTIFDGPGIPAVSLAVLAYGIACVAEKKLIVSWTVVSLIAAFAISFGLLLFVFQLARGVLVLPLLGIIALVMVRACAIVRPYWLRWVFSVALLLGGVHHLRVLTFTFSTEPNSRTDFGPFENRFPLWNHQNFFTNVAGSYAKDPEWSARMKALGDRLETLTIPDGSKVCLLVDEPIFQCNSLRLEFLHRRMNCEASTIPLLPLNIVEKRKHTLQRMIEDCEVLVLRAPFKSTPFDQMAKLLTKPLLQGATKRFERIGDPMPFEGTSTLLIYQQIPRLSHVSTIPGDAIPVNVQFYNPDTKASLRRIMVDAACFTTEDEKRLLTIYLTLHGAGSLPMVCLYAAPIGGESRAVSSFEFSEPALSAAAPSDCSKRKVRIYLNDMLKPDIPTRGCEFSLVFEDKITGFRWIAPPHSNGEPRAQMPILTIQPAKK